MKNKNKIIVLAVIIFCMIVAFFAGYFFSVKTLVSADVMFSRPLTDWFKSQRAIFFEANTVDEKNIEAFNRVSTVLSTRYYEPIDVDKAFSSAIKGFAQGLGDPYTVYYDPEDMKQFLETTSGNYVGIGVMVQMDENNLLTVADVFADSPAKEVGLQKGDKIIQVDNEDVTGIKDADLIVKRIKGVSGTSVKITVFRPDIKDNKEFVLKRKAINVSYIKSEVLENNIGYIQIKQFDNDIASDFQNHLNGLLKQGIKGLVIDLRDNPGGDYYQVVKICDMLLPKGLIVYVEDRNKVRDEEYSDASELNMPMSILVNGYSASASEIMAAAIKDFGKGEIIGTKTFGKGLVQQIDTKFTNGGGLKFTIARYYTPSGKCIHGLGVEPTLEVQLPEQFKNTSIDDIPEAEDTQLQAGIKEIRKALK